MRWLVLLALLAFTAFLPTASLRSLVADADSLVPVFLATGRSERSDAGEGRVYAAQDTSGGSQDVPPPACPETEPTATAAAPPPIPARIDGPAGVVALTFDAGADRGYAADILDALSEAGIPATFGMTGKWAEANPELVQRMAADGHMVINHTLDHRSFTGLSDHLGGLSADSRRDELLQADAIIAPLIGHTTCPWYRLPYGDGDRRVVGDVLEAGYNQQVGWTIDTLGWRGSPVQNIVQRSLRLAAPNAVYVMHVGIQSRDGPALPSVIEGLQAMGYGFATVATIQ